MTSPPQWRLARWSASGVVLLALAAPAAHAETVYRCGNAYAQTPCPAANTLDVNDARSVAQRADAVEVAARERRLGNRLQSERLRQEAATPAARAARLDGDASLTATPRPKKVRSWPAPKKKKAAKVSAAVT